jgi:hypothetical protein
VRIIVPYPAGGSTDVLSRILAERMKEMFGQPFVIENRPGAGGNIGIPAVTGSPASGAKIDCPGQRRNFEPSPSPVSVFMKTTRSCRSASLSWIGTSSGERLGRSMPPFS